jgi:hypothetical protein
MYSKMYAPLIWKYSFFLIFDIVFDVRARIEGWYVLTVLYAMLRLRFLLTMLTSTFGSHHPNESLAPAVSRIEKDNHQVT